MLALRIRPPVPANLQREVPEEGMMIAGQYIPAGVGASTDLLILDCGEYTNVHNNA